MTTKYVKYCSNVRVSCAQAETPDVIICLQSADLIVQPDPACDLPITTIDAQICQAYTLSDGCQNPIWNYTFQYNDEQLTNPSTPLASSDITGFFCKNCETDWIEQQISCSSGSGGSCATPTLLANNEFPSGSISVPEPTDLLSYTIPAHKISLDALDSIKFEAWGDFQWDGADSDFDPNLIVRFNVNGDTLIQLTFNTHLEGIISGVWTVYGTVSMYNAESNSVAVSATGIVTSTDDPTQNVTITNNTDFDWDDVTPIPLAFTGQGNIEESPVGVGSVFQRKMIVTYFCGP